MRLARGKFGNFEETDASIEVNTDVNRSDEVHERRQRQRNYDSDRGGNRGGYGGNQGQSNNRRW